MLALAKHVTLLLGAFASILRLLKNDLPHTAPRAALAHPYFLWALSDLPDSCPKERQWDCHLGEHKNSVITGNNKYKYKGGNCNRAYSLRQYQAFTQGSISEQQALKLQQKHVRHSPKEAPWPMQWPCWLGSHSLHFKPLINWIFLFLLCHLSAFTCEKYWTIITAT